MASRIEARLRELNLELPEAARPVANFVPCVQAGSLLFVSGQITTWNGQLRHVGQVGAQVSVDEARAGARLCALNLLAHVRDFLGDLDRVERVVEVRGFVNTAPGFTQQPAVVNGASDVFLDVFGEAGRHARFAVGVASLPAGAAVEVAATFAVREVSSRRVDVFFYGLFMDVELLRAKGLEPKGVELAAVDDLALRIAQRAALVPVAGARVHGVVMSLTVSELDQLYSEPSVRAYRPQAVLAHLAGGEVIAALCYNLPEPPSPTERNEEYAGKLRAIAEKIGLPAEYVTFLR
jgi:enamine deaminase RidA (YjgF/YER057c/UK114 family)